MIESAEDLAALFHPDDFGVPMIAHMPDASLPFHGVPTSGSLAVAPGTTADATSIVPRIIATVAAVGALAQGDEIELPGGRRVVVNDMLVKGAVVVIHYHDRW